MELNKPAPTVDAHQLAVQAELNLLSKPSSTCCPQGKGRGYGVLSVEAPCSRGTG